MKIDYFSESRMVLSMMQPYAWLFINGILKVDDRTWNTSYRGLLWIHASTGFNQKLYDLLKLSTNLKLPSIESFDKGGLMGHVELIDVIPPGSTAYPSHLRAHGGPGGYYGFVLANPTKTPFEKLRGRPGLFKAPNYPRAHAHF